MENRYSNDLFIVAVYKNIKIAVLYRDKPTTPISTLSPNAPDKENLHLYGVFFHLPANFQNLFLFIAKYMSLDIRCIIYVSWLYTTDYNRLLTTDFYNRLLGNNITSDYRKCENGVKHKIDKETKKIAESLDLSNKMECYASRLPFIPIKDHKPNFENNTKCRLINPAKKRIRTC